MRVLIDTDVLIDVALKRPEFFHDSHRILEWVETGGGEAAVAWHSISNLAYMMDNARGFIRDLVQFVEVAPGGASEILSALDFADEGFGGCNASGSSKIVQRSLVNHP